MLGQPCKAGQIIENTGEYFEWQRNEVKKPDFLTDNFLSTDRRVSIQEIGINACSPLATNAIRGDIWDNFSSETYKELPATGQITLYNPIDGTPFQYDMRGGGRGYVRPASLISVWSTAPFLQNNSVGPFNWNPSVESRLDSFNESHHADAVAGKARQGSRYRRSNSGAEPDPAHHGDQLSQGAGGLSAGRPQSNSPATSALGRTSWRPGCSPNPATS